MKMKYLLIIGIIVAMAIVGWSASGYFVKSDNSSDFDKLAKCLTEKGAIMYGAEWCGHCKDQKEMFGDSFKYINYVECPDNQDVCLNAGIEGYPTWIIKGVSYPGVQSFERLKELTGCT